MTETIAIHAVRDIAQQAASPHLLKLDDGRVFAAVADTHKLTEITGPDWRPMLPDHIDQTLQLTQKASLVDYICAFAEPGARAFLDVERAAITAVLDYHYGETDKPDAMAPGTCRHVARLQLAATEEWTRWTAISGKLMGQMDFARFLEENAADVAAPAGADLLEIVKDLSAVRKADFRSEIRLHNGDQAFEWVEETQAKTKSGQIEVPRRFLLQIPIFYGERSVEVGAFLRYSLNDGALKLGVELHRPVFLRLAMLEEIGRDVAAQAHIPLHFAQLATRG